MTDDDLLTPKPVPPNEALQAAILERTMRWVRLARWQRRAMIIAGALVCFGLGCATAFLRPKPAPQIVYVEVSGEVKAPGSPTVPKSEPAKQLSPAQLELTAEQTDDRPAAARRFREAGDRYLREFADYRAALRCYRNFLDEADPADRVVGPDDTWLLTSLKRAREQESTQ
jgi:hypothetical protein